MAKFYNLNSRPKSQTNKEKDDVLFRSTIASSLTDFQSVSVVTEIPVINSYSVDEDFIRSKNSLLGFTSAISSDNYDEIVHFYLNDNQFIRVFNNPSKYVDILKGYKYVITPDCSQYINMPQLQRMSHSFWNKAIAAYWQKHGINIIFNVSWSCPESYDYAFAGLPKGCVIAINCTGVIGCSASKYLWQKGYNEAIARLEPSLIIRYGDKMPNERDDISVYFDNINLMNLRNGGKRK